MDSGRREVPIAAAVLLVVCVSVLVDVPHVHASTIYLASPCATLACTFSNSVHWMGSVVPTSADDIVLVDGNLLQISGAVSVRSLTVIASGGNVTIVFQGSDASLSLVAPQYSVALDLRNLLPAYFIVTTNGAYTSTTVGGATLGVTNGGSVLMRAHSGWIIRGGSTATGFDSDVDLSTLLVKFSAPAAVAAQNMVGSGFNFSAEGTVLSLEGRSQVYASSSYVWGIDHPGTTPSDLLVVNVRTTSARDRNDLTTGWSATFPVMTTAAVGSTQYVAIRYPEPAPAAPFPGESRLFFNPYYDSNTPQFFPFTGQIDTAQLLAPILTLYMPPSGVRFQSSAYPAVGFLTVADYTTVNVNVPLVGTVVATGTSALVTFQRCFLKNVDAVTNALGGISITDQAGGPPVMEVPNAINGAEGVSIRGALHVFGHTADAQADTIQFPMGITVYSSFHLIHACPPFFDATCSPAKVELGDILFSPPSPGVVPLLFNLSRVILVGTGPATWTTSSYPPPPGYVPVVLVVGDFQVQRYAAPVPTRITIQNGVKLGGTGMLSGIVGGSTASATAGLTLTIRNGTDPVLGVGNFFAFNNFGWLTTDTLSRCAGSIRLVCLQCVLEVPGSGIVATVPGNFEIVSELYLSGADTSTLFFPSLVMQSNHHIYTHGPGVATSPAFVSESVFGCIDVSNTVEFGYNPTFTATLALYGGMYGTLGTCMVSNNAANYKLQLTGTLYSLPGDTTPIHLGDITLLNTLNIDGIAELRLHGDSTYVQMPRSLGTAANARVYPHTQLMLTGTGTLTIGNGVEFNSVSPTLQCTVFNQQFIVGDIWLRNGIPAGYAGGGSIANVLALFGPCVVPTGGRLTVHALPDYNNVTAVMSLDLIGGGDTLYVGDGAELRFTHNTQLYNWNNPGGTLRSIASVVGSGGNVVFEDSTTTLKCVVNTGNSFFFLNGATLRSAIAAPNRVVFSGTGYSTLIGVTALDRATIENGVEVTGNSNHAWTNMLMRNSSFLRFGAGSSISIFTLSASNLTGRIEAILPVLKPTIQFLTALSYVDGDMVWDTVTVANSLTLAQASPHVLAGASLTLVNCRITGRAFAGFGSLYFNKTRSILVPSDVNAHAFGGLKVFMSTNVNITGLSALISQQFVMTSLSLGVGTKLTLLGTANPLAGLAINSLDLPVGAQILTFSAGVSFAAANVRGKIVCAGPPTQTHAVVLIGTAFDGSTFEIESSYGASVVVRLQGAVVPSGVKIPTSPFKLVVLANSTVGMFNRGGSPDYPELRVTSGSLTFAADVTSHTVNSVYLASGTSIHAMVYFQLLTPNLALWYANATTGYPAVELANMNLQVGYVAVTAAPTDPANFNAINTFVQRDGGLLSVEYTVSVVSSDALKTSQVVWRLTDFTNQLPLGQRTSTHFEVAGGFTFPGFNSTTSLAPSVVIDICWDDYTGVGVGATVHYQPDPAMYCPPHSSSALPALSSTAVPISSSAEPLSSSALPLSSSAQPLPVSSSSALPAGGGAGVSSSASAAPVSSTAVAAPALSSTAVATPAGPSSSAPAAPAGVSSSSALPAPPAAAGPSSSSSALPAPGVAPSSSAAAPPVAGVSSTAPAIPEVNGTVCADKPCGSIDGSTCHDEVNLVDGVYVRSFVCTCPSHWLTPQCKFCDYCVGAGSDCLYAPAPQYQNHFCMCSASSFMDGSNCDKSLLSTITYAVTEFSLLLKASSTQPNTSATVNDLLAYAERFRLAAVARNVSATLDFSVRSRRIVASSSVQLSIWVVVVPRVAPVASAARTKDMALAAFEDDASAAIVQLASLISITGAFDESLMIEKLTSAHGTTVAGSAVVADDPKPPATNGASLSDVASSNQNLLIIIIAVVGALLLAYVALWYWSQRQSSGRSRINELLFAALSVFNFTTNILFVIDLYRSRTGEGSNGYGVVLFYVCMICLLISVLLNVSVAVWIILSEFHRKVFARWAQRTNNRGLAIAVVLSPAGIANLRFADSFIAGAEMLSAPYSDRAIQRIEVSGLGAILFVQIPFLTISSLAAANDGWTIATLGTVLLSALTLAVGMTSKCLTVCLMAVRTKTQREKYQNTTANSTAAGGAAGDVEIGASPAAAASDVGGVVGAEVGMTGRNQTGRVVSARGTAAGTGGGGTRTSAFGVNLELAAKTTTIAPTPDAPPVVVPVPMPAASAPVLLPGVNPAEAATVDMQPA